MPNVRIPLFQAAQKNVDEIQLRSFASSLINGYIDEAEFINRRPGYSTFVDLSTSGTLLTDGTDSAIDGLFWWNEANIHVAVAGSRVYGITVAGVPSRITGATTAESGSTLPTNKVSFTAMKIANVDTLFLASGGNVFYTQGSTLVNMEDVDADIPSAVDQVTNLDSYLIVNSLTAGERGRIYFSNVLDATDWDGDFASAEAKPDNIDGIRVVGAELILLGTQSIEHFYDDGATPFVRYKGGEIQNGVSAKDTIVQIDNVLFFLDTQRRLVVLQGRTFKPVSAPFDRTIQSLSSVTDAYAENIRIAGKSFYMITFPTASRTAYDSSSKTGITWVYDYVLDRWYEWGLWDAGNTEYGPFVASTHDYVIPTGNNYVGSKEADGLIYTLDADVYQDAGAVLRTQIDSGFFDHGTLQMKEVKRFLARLKRGVGTSDTVSVKYKNENETTYGSEFLIDLSTDAEFFIQEGPLGSYRARSYRVVSESNTQFVMGSVEEDIVGLEI